MLSDGSETLPNAWLGEFLPLNTILPRKGFYFVNWSIISFAIRSLSSLRIYAKQSWIFVSSDFSKVCIFEYWDNIQKSFKVTKPRFCTSRYYHTKSMSLELSLTRNLSSPVIKCDFLIYPLPFKSKKRKAPVVLRCRSSILT